MTTTEEYDDLTEEEIAALQDDDAGEQEEDDASDKDDGAQADDKKEEAEDGKTEDDKKDAGETEQDDKSDTDTEEADTKRVAEEDDSGGQEDSAGDDTEEEIEDQEIDFVPTKAVAPVMADTELKALDDDLKAKISGFNEELKALKDKFGEGEMSTDDYVDKRDEIKDKIADAKQDVRDKKRDNDANVRMNKATLEANWQGAQAAFFRANKAFKSGIVRTLFATKVNTLLNDPKSNNMSDIEVLQACRKEVVSDFKKSGAVIPGVTDTGKKADGKDSTRDKKAQALKAAKKAKAKDNGRNLSDVSVDDNIDTGSWMDRLDELMEKDGERFEEEIDKLTPAQREKYLAR